MSRVSQTSSLSYPQGYNVPLDSPVHNVVTSNGSRSPVEDLGREPPPRVEDGIVSGTGERVLAVGGDTVGQDALLGKTTCILLDPFSIFGVLAMSVVVVDCGRCYGGLSHRHRPLQVTSITIHVSIALKGTHRGYPSHRGT